MGPSCSRCLKFGVGGHSPPPWGEEREWFQEPPTPWGCGAAPALWFAWAYSVFIFL